MDSGSEYEFVDKENGLHLYVLEKIRDNVGVLHYTVGVASTATNATTSASYGIEMGSGKVAHSASAANGTYCTFELKNTGKAAKLATNPHPQDLSAYLGSDIYRLEAGVKGEGWKVAVPNALAYAKAGKQTTVKVAVGCEGGCSKEATVSLKVTSEGDKSVSRVKTCKVRL
jgi:hypothetical protein